VSTVITVRISKELKKKMDALRGKVNWSKEIRAFIERVIREYEQMEAIEELESLIKSLPSAKEGTAHKLVREDRDSN